MKYYRVIKDHPMWEVGAVIKSDGSSYKPVSGLWVKDLHPDVDESWSEGVELVEHQPEWFERVYEVSLLGKVKYVVKKEALKAQQALYSPKKGKL